MIRVHDDATADLRHIRTTDPRGFYRLVALIEQLKADPALGHKLLEHGYGDDRSEAISVRKWGSVQSRVERLPVWRLKSWDLERAGLRYRLVYLYYWRDRSFNILAIVSRDEMNYDDPNHPLRKRITRTIRDEFPRP